MDYRDNRRRWTESHQVVHFYAGPWCTFTPALTVAGKEGNPLAVAYSAAKAGVIGMTKSLAKELVDDGIYVNCVTPAMTETDFLQEMTDDYISMVKSKIPMGRLCTVSEIADMIAWIAGPQCTFTTGAVFDLSGGRATY